MSKHEKMYRVLKDDKLGRYLVADKPIKKGALIFTDIPFVFGPKPDSPTVCLGCHGFWNKKYYCKVCAWPCCDVTCEEKIIHRENECKVFAEANVKYQPSQDNGPCTQYDCITPLRLLLSKEKYPQRWKNEISIMEDHEFERRKLTTWEIDDINITKYLTGPVKLQDRFSEKLIQKVCGILEVNALEIPLRTGPNIRGIYPQISIMSHNCVPNIIQTVEMNSNNNIPPYLARIWAATDINENEKLELCYTDVLHCTVQRRTFLRRSKFFDCECERCSDPTELGTDMSTLRCNNCENGFVRSTNPLDDEATWKCLNCDYSTTNKHVLNLISLIHRETYEDIFNYCGVEKLLQDEIWCKNILHRNHSLIISLNYEIIKFGTNSKEKMQADELQRRIKRIYRVLDILNVISPGLTRMRGRILYELCNLLLSSKFETAALDLLPALNEAREILTREDEESELGILGRECEKKYDELALLRK